jgi:CRISPR-associated protein Cmr6
MTIELMRTVLRPLYRAAGDAHPGLLIQRGYQAFDNTSEEGRKQKTAHIERICGIPANSLYTRAFQRWQTATGDGLRFHAVALELQARLFIGLTGGGMLETGCAISHSYGVPYIPGSSIKGVVSAFARASAFGSAHPEVCDELFGAEPTDENPAGLAGLIAFHDAWWVPGSAPTPLVQEVVTTHHLDYYGSEGMTPATDLDSPIPNAQIGVRGSFLFVLEGLIDGPLAWLHLTGEMLVAAMSNVGVGAKTRSGYGFFESSVSASNPQYRCAWVDDTIAILMKKNNAKEDDTLRGKGLANEWKALADAELKAQALAYIQARLEAKGWWEKPQGGSAKEAKAIYTAP